MYKYRVPGWYVGRYTRKLFSHKEEWNLAI